MPPNPPIDSMRVIELKQKNRSVKVSGNARLGIDREIARLRGLTHRLDIRQGHSRRPQ
jgi:hypothetical protein